MANDNAPKNTPSINTAKSIQIEGLNNFIENLKTCFFATVNIKKHTTTSSELKLSIELDCDFRFVETLHYFNKEVWGSFAINKKSFLEEIQSLRDQNNVDIVIDELSIFLNDTSVIIKSIYRDSIPEQFENIITEISAHFIHFTKGLSEVPFEIYVPIFKDEKNNSETTRNLKNTKTNIEEDFFNYWGLYFYSSEITDIHMYDIKNQTVLKGDLQMLNRQN